MLITYEPIANECAKFIIQSGIKEIVFVKDDDADSDSSRASRILFEVAGVKMTKIEPSIPSIKIIFPNGSSSSTKPGKKTNNVNLNEDEMEKYLGLMQREASIDPFKYKVQKRADYLTWDEYFMGVAFLSARRSKDPNTQVGACIVDADKCIIGIGYNGFPRGCSDEILPWARSGSCDLHKKYPYGKSFICLKPWPFFFLAYCKMLIYSTTFTHHSRACRGKCYFEQMQCQCSGSNNIRCLVPMQ